MAHRPTHRSLHFGFVTGLALSLLLTAAPVRAQTPAQTPAAPTPEQPATLAIEIERSNESALLTYFNRPIVTFRARIMGRSPEERRSAAVLTLDALVAERITGPVEARPTTGGVLVGIGPRVIVSLTDADLDPLTGETLTRVVDDTIQRLQVALVEADQAHRPRIWIRGGLRVAGVLLVSLLALWGLGWARRRSLDSLSVFTRHIVDRVGLDAQAGQSVFGLLNFLQRRLLMLALVVLRLVVLYGLVTFTLRQFPYTRPWGESLRGTLLGVLGSLLQDVVNSIPGLLAVAIILAMTRLVAQVIRPWFDAVERGAIKVHWVHAETARTTRQLVTIGLWLLAGAVAYPYVPGSGTEAFKGLSVFVGLMVTFGSSGLVNQIMSGFMITYARALRLNDYVKVGDVEGTITHLGLLSAKIQTLRSEEITIPNAVIVSTTVTDYSRFADTVQTTTALTIGYDAPWRQIHGMLLSAAERTPGIRRTPAPRVLQVGLEDAAVRYTLSFCLERQQSKMMTLTVLHAHIQDLFNEYGVQIMTPNYEADPATPKVVQRADWFAAPARTDDPIIGDTRPTPEARALTKDAART